MILTSNSSYTQGNIDRDVAGAERWNELNKEYFKAIPEVCVERPYLITKYCRNNNLFGKEKISILEKAKLYRYVMENRKPIVSHSSCYTVTRQGSKPRSERIKDNSLFIGSVTSKFKGVLIFPEFLGMTLWPELKTVSRRKENPYHLSKEDSRILNKEVFPYWMHDSILEITRNKFKQDKEVVKGLDLFQEMVFFLATEMECISHTVPDFSKVLDVGISGIIENAREKMALETNIEKCEFYAAIVEGLKGIIAYSGNLAAEARLQAAEISDEKRKKELLDIADIYERVPSNKASTFREGLCAIWICWIAIHIENPDIGMSLGRLDQVLYPLYANDIRCGVIDESEALELLCCFWLKLGDHVPMIPETGEALFGGTGSNQAITIGGVVANDDEIPQDAVNDLTRMILRATEIMMLRDPNLNARYYPGVNSEEYLAELCRANIKTKATPAMHNDVAVIKALQGQGLSLSQARDYAIVGCVEPVSNGRAYTASAAVLLNLVSVLELTLFNGCHRHTGLDRVISIQTGDFSSQNPSIDSMDRFKEAFSNQLEWMASITVKLNNALESVHRDVYPTPILSALFEGPMDKGKDLIEGGAVINAAGVTVIGLADVADSLAVIQEKVFTDNTFESIPQKTLIDAINSNFVGYSDELTQALSVKKYGADSEGCNAQNNACWLIQKLSDKYQNYETYRGGKYRVGYWTLTNHAGFGKLSQALPSGRLSKENFASGITPVSAVTPILTENLRSVAKLPTDCITNGMAYNLKYTPEKDVDRLLSNFVATVKTYFQEGGMEIQFNVTSHKDLLNAMEHPEDYQELLVRVSGYTAYFVDLNKQMQKEIVDRSEFLLKDEEGLLVPCDPLPVDEGSSNMNFDWINIGILRWNIDDKLEILLRLLPVYSLVDCDFKKSIKYFNAKYVFAAEDKSFGMTLIFANGDISVDSDEVNDYSVRIEFKTTGSLLELIFAQGGDILQSLLKNEVHVQGNLNYLYRFAAMAREVQYRFTL